MKIVDERKSLDQISQLNRQKAVFGDFEKTQEGIDQIKAQIAEIEQVSRQALADVRTTASGMREVRLATEIASARSVLLAAGIESRMPSALPPLTDRMSELMGYVVREAVTNVVRHSRAGVCTVVVRPSAVEVRDDGRGLPSGVRSGSGLLGLRTRVEAAVHRPVNPTVLTPEEFAAPSGVLDNVRSGPAVAVIGELPWR